MSDPIYVNPDDEQNFSFIYADGGDTTTRDQIASQWKTFNRTDPATGKSFKIYTRSTSTVMQASANYTLPAGTSAGRYRIEAYIPGIHATTRNAIFAVASNFRQSDGQTIYDNPLTIIDMYDLYDVWTSLGEFDLDPQTYPTAGRVRQFDLSREDPAAEITFGPIRWVPVTAISEGALRFSSPVGARAEREAVFPAGAYFSKKYPIWVGEWFDCNPFLNWYEQGYHTGADLNLPGASGADKGKPVYCAADGVVTFAGKASSWGNIIVIEHPDGLVTLPSGKVQSQKVYTRYGHLDNRLLVKTGQPVQQGQNIGFIGLAPGYISGWHLHFDVSYTDLLKRQPAHWPSLSTIQSLKQARKSTSSREYLAAQNAIKKEVLAHYIDPLKFLRDNHIAT